MKRSLVNLENEEAAIVAAYKSGETIAVGMREHLNNIRKYALYEATDCENFEQYVKLERLPFEYRTALEIGAQGEVEGYLEKRGAPLFSGRALTELSRIRQVNDDGTKSHAMHKPRIQSVEKKAIAHHDKTGEPITGSLIKSIIATMPWNKEKLPKHFGEQCEKEIAKLGRLAVSYKQLDGDVFLDAEEEYPGSVTRLAKAYSDIASLLRKVLK